MIMLTIGEALIVARVWTRIEEEPISNDAVKWGQGMLIFLWACSLFVMWGVYFVVTRR